MGTTTIKGVPYPVDADPPDVPKDMGALASWNDTNPGVAIMTSAQRDALPAAQKWIGRVIYNTTTTTHEGYNGTTWLPIGAGVQALSQAQINALPAAMKTVGMIVWNTDTTQHQSWDGAKWVFVDAIPRVANATAAAALGNLPDGTLVWCLNPPQMLRWSAGTYYYESGTYPNSTGNLDGYDAAARIPWGYLGMNTDYSMWEGLVGGGLWDFAGIPKLTTTQRDALATKRKRGGALIFNTTTQRHEWYDLAATTWRALNPYTSGAYGAVAHYDIAAGAATSGTALKLIGSFTFTALAGRVYAVEGFCVLHMSTGGDLANFTVNDGSTGISSTGVSMPVSTYATLDCFGRIKAGPSTRTVTVNLYIQNSFGSGVADVTNTNGHIDVYDVGEDGQVVTPTTIVPPDVWNAAWGVVAQAPVTASGPNTQGTVVDLPGSSLTFTPVMGRRYRVSVQCNPVIDTAGSVCNVLVRDGGNTNLTGQSMAPTLTNVSALLAFSTVITPASATPLTYKISYFRQAGGGNVYIYADPTVVARLAVEDIGPATVLPPTSWAPKPNPGPWTALPYAAGFADSGGGLMPGQYRINGDRVELRGVVTQSILANTLIATLPVGARPTANQVMYVNGYRAGVGDGPMRADIATTGTLTLVGGGTAVAQNFDIHTLFWFTS